MKRFEPSRGFSKFQHRTSVPVKISAEHLVKTRYLNDENLPLVIEPSERTDIALVAWGEANREWLKKMLVGSGALLLRGFPIGSVTVFEDFVNAVWGQLLSYNERSSPRSHVQGNVFTSTDYPENEMIFLHNEQSYNKTFPMVIAFCCLQPAARGGATPIANSRKVLQHLPRPLVERFVKQGYVLQRNLGTGLGLSWQNAFQTQDREVVENHCRANEIAWNWLPGDVLRTRQVRPVLARHPDSGELTWFNHMTFFHLSTLSQAIREALTVNFSSEEFPQNTYYADGSPIEPEILEALRRAYVHESVSFPWNAGDILVLDNMLTSHGRTTFEGPRRVVVAMARPCSWDQVQVHDLP
jgi:alpha-ketoglutarate-dependent taurine dioxygenase